jgi:heptosyltransferase I
VIDPSSLRRILLVRLSSFGDVVRATGCLRLLRQASPEAEIVAVTDAPLAPVFRQAPGGALVIESSGEARLPLVWLEARRAFRPLRRAGGFDLAIDLQGTRRSALWTYASAARIKAGRGYRRPLWLFAQPPDYREADVAESAGILARLGIPAADPSPELHCRAADEASLEAKLASAGLPGSGYLLVNPFSRWPSKSWPLERYALLLPALRRETATPVIVSGGAEETQSGEQLVARLPPGTAVSLAGRLGLGELFALLRRARLVISVDSGPMHAAAALGTPVLALFGPTWPERAGPWGEGHRVLQRRRAARYHAYQGPDGADCMAAISVEDVLQAARQQLAVPR